MLSYAWILVGGSPANGTPNKIYRKPVPKPGGSKSFLREAL
jgi:hypothetical protein